LPVSATEISSGLRWAAAVAVAAVLAVACRTAAPPAIRRAPDPTLAPVPGLPLTVVQASAARAAVAFAERGDRVEAEQQAHDLPAGHPVTALVALEVRLFSGEDIAADVRTLAEANPDYAAAWAVTGLAARRAGNLRLARTALQRTADLWPAANWRAAAEEAESALVTSLVSMASARLADGDAAGAQAASEECLNIRPSEVAARMVLVRVHLLSGDVAAAARLLPALPDSAEGLELKGRVAERLGQWELAVDFYFRMPAGDPRRCPLLVEARHQWRIANASPLLARAMKAAVLTRRGLAVILTATVPVVAELAQGAVPVFEDVVQLAERRDVVTVARAGVMPGDEVARRWAPNRTVTGREMREVGGRLARALRRPAPTWCDGVAAVDCLAVPDPVSGEGASAIVERIAASEEDPCHRP